MSFSSKERDSELFRSISEAHQHIEQYIDSLSRAEFLMDSKTQDAVAMRLQQALECAGKLSENAKSKLKINWSSLVAMRNKISHHYDNVNPQIIWEVVKELKEYQSLINFARKQI